MVHDDDTLARFRSTFRQRFAALFGRKIGRQRAEQYLGGLLSARATRRNVTSLANTVDGATGRALGWLLNKSPWEARPVVDALQTYVGDVIGSEHGVFALNLASFVKRGDNAVGVARQYLAHVGRTQNCQIGVFLAYGTERGSSLVDAALYLPQEWTDDPARRRRAGVPDSVAYASHGDLAIGLLRRVRDSGHLPGQWVTIQHVDAFGPDLRRRLDADGWWYLLPVAPDTSVFTSPDDTAPRPVARLLREGRRRIRGPACLGERRRRARPGRLAGQQPGPPDRQVVDAAVQRARVGEPGDVGARAVDPLVSGGR